MPGRLMPLCSPSMPPLMTSQSTSLPRTPAHAQFDQAIAEQDAGAGREFAGEIGERGGDAGGGAGNILRRDGDHRTGFQQDGLVALQGAGADFRALQVLQDADGASLALGGAAQAVDVVGVIFVGAVGKVEARDVHAEAEQVAHGGFGVAGGTDGADDLGAARRGLHRGGICDRFWLAGLQPVSYRGCGTSGYSSCRFSTMVRETLQNRLSGLKARFRSGL